jgi:hypothetical protein
MARTIHDIDPKTLRKGAGPSPDWFKEDSEEPQRPQLVTRQATQKLVDENGLNPEHTLYGKLYPTNTGFFSSKSVVLNAGAKSPTFTIHGSNGMLVCLRGKAKLTVEGNMNKISLEDGTIYHLNEHDSFYLNTDEVTHVRVISLADSNINVDDSQVEPGEESVIPEKRVASKAREQLLAQATEQAARHGATVPLPPTASPKPLTAEQLAAIEASQVD